MDLALIYNPTLQAFDLALTGADLASEDTLASAVLASLLSDRIAEIYEVPAGADRRGWWADAYADNNHKTGSRLWLLEREKQLPGVVLRCKQYCEEALQWFIDDELAKAIIVTVFAPRPGMLAALIKFEINEGVRNYRFEFNDVTQVWRLAGEGL
jgi:phage gp46-like protein